MQGTWEVEQKYFVGDEENLRENLTRLGFTQVNVERHSDVYFRHPCRDFRKTDEAFRLRQIDDQTFVTYKGKRLESTVKTRPEIELGLLPSEFAQWTQLLELLGFNPLPAVHKSRRVFLPSQNNTEHQGFTVTLDEVESLGLFAEIELLVKSSEQLQDAERRIVKLGGELGLQDVQPKSYLAMLLSKLGIE